MLLCSLVIKREIAKRCGDRNDLKNNYEYGDDGFSTNYYQTIRAGEGVIVELIIRREFMSSARGGYEYVRCFSVYIVSNNRLIVLVRFQ